MNESAAVSVESKRLTLFNKEQVSLVVGRIADEVGYRSSWPQHCFSPLLQKWMSFLDMTGHRHWRAPFAGHLDLSRIGVFGHSIGGMAAARACQIDSRIRACSDQDSTDDLGSPFPVSTPGSIPKQPLLLFIASSCDIFSQEALHPSEESLSKQKLSREQIPTKSFRSNRRNKKKYSRRSPAAVSA